MTLSKKKKDYSLPANQIYTTLFDSLKNNNNFSEVSSDENTFQISVITPPSIKTHGEKMTITIESITDSASTIEI